MTFLTVVIILLVSVVFDIGSIFKNQGNSILWVFPFKVLFFAHIECYQPFE